MMEISNGVEALISYLLFCQILGAFVGAGTSVWAELAYIRTRRVRSEEAAQQAYMKSIARGLLWGLVPVLLMTEALVVLAFVQQIPVQPAQLIGFWLLMLVALTLVFVAWALSKRHISHTLASAMLFCGWWFLVYLLLGLVSPASLGAALALLVVATAVWYGGLSYARFLLSPS